MIRKSPPCLEDAQFSDNLANVSKLALFLSVSIMERLWMLEMSWKWVFICLKLFHQPSLTFADNYSLGNGKICQHNICLWLFRGAG